MAYENRRQMFHITNSSTKSHSFRDVLLLYEIRFCCIAQARAGNSLWADRITFKFKTISLWSLEIILLQDKNWINAIVILLQYS